jgi:hypothetical protein
MSMFLRTNEKSCHKREEIDFLRIDDRKAGREGCLL